MGIKSVRGVGPIKEFVTVSGDRNVYNGSDRAEGVTVTGNFNKINGGGGDDILVALSGHHNILEGGTGNDTMGAAGNNNTVSGGAGNDRVDTYYGTNNTLLGGDGNDIISSKYSSGSVLNGGAGNDTLVTHDASVLGLSGAAYNIGSTVTGGSGRDTFTFGGVAHADKSLTSHTVTDFNVAEDRLFLSGNNGAYGHKQLDANVAFTNGDAVVTVADIGMKITLVGIDQNEWSQLNLLS